MIKKLSIFVLIIGLFGLANAASLFSLDPNPTKPVPMSTNIEGTDDIRAEDTIAYDGPNAANGIGLTAGGTFWGAVRFTPVDACSLKAAIFFLYGAVSAPGYVYIHGPGTNAPGPKLDSVPYTGTTGVWNRVNFTSNLFLPAGTDFWLDLRLTHAAGQYPFGVDAGPSVTPARSYVSMDGVVWQSLASIPLNYNWNMRAIVVFRRFNNDVGVDAVLAPGAYHLPNTVMTPSARIKNYGSLTQTSFPVVCSIVGPGGVFRYTNTQTVASLAANTTTNVTFTGWTPTVTEIVTVIFRTNLTGDENTANDRKVQTCNISNVYNQDFEASNAGYVADPASSAWEWDTPTSGPMAAHSGTKLWATLLGGNYANSANWKLTSCEYRATASNPTLKFWHWYNMEAYYDGGNVKISTDNGATWTPLTPTGGYPEDAAYTGNVGIPGEACYSGIAETWAEAEFPLTVSSGQAFLLRWHFGSDPSVQRSGWYIDDVLGIGFGIQAPGQRDVGVDAIRVPGPNARVNVAIVPMALVKNYGAGTMTSFPVVCSIVGGGSAVRYTNTQTVATLAAGDTIRVNFTSWTPTILENVNVAMRTNLTNDTNPGNDRKTVTTAITNYLASEGFNDITFPPTGWQAIPSGSYNWARFTTGSNPVCTPYEGAAMAGFECFSATAGSFARLISPALAAGATAVPCTLKFNMYHDDAYPGGTYGPDSVKVETSPNGTSFTRVAAFVRYNTTNAWQEHAVYLGSFSGTFYISMLGWSDYGNNIFIDNIRINAPMGIEENPNTNIYISSLNTVKPNPVRGIAHISFNIANPSQTNVRIYDASGRIVKTLVNSQLDRGTYNMTWNGTDDNNREVSEGIYFYTLETENHSQTKKLVLTR